MKEGKNKYQLDHTLKPLVFELIRNHKNDEVKKYLGKNPEEIHLKGWMSNTPLHIACLSGNFEIVKYLIKNGANVNAQRTGVYATPLCWADNEEIAKYLLDEGATMNDLELYRATREDKIPIIELLLKSGAKINEKEPQYLQCKSKEAIEVYLNHNININGTNENQSNLLHKLAWLDLAEVFDFAYKNGVEWKKDSSRRTPYILAKYGGRESIIKHISDNYQNLISNNIKSLGLDFEYERISYLKKHPNKPSYLGLTSNGKLIEYGIDGQQRISIQNAIEIDVSIIHNFTIDSLNQLIIPTGENKLLKLDASSFQLIEKIEFAEDDIFEQITYLPKREVFIGSSHEWNIYILDKAFNIISKTDAEDGTLFPIINESENLLGFWSYDQEIFFDLYEIGEENEVNYIHTFFEDRNSISMSLAFFNNHILVAYPKKIEVYKFEEGELERANICKIEEYKSSYDICSLTVVSKDVFLFGKGSTIVAYRKLPEEIVKIEEMDLNLADEIKEIHFDKEESKLIVITDLEIDLINLKGKNWAQ